MTTKSPPITTVKFGNTNPMMQAQRVVDGQVEQFSEPAPHLNQSVTAINMRPDFADADVVELTLSTDNDRQLINVARVLGDEHRVYAVGVHELDQIVGVHAGGARPAWVTSTDPAFEAALAVYFGCPRGEPEAATTLTNGGRDALHHQFLDTAAPPATFNYGALTANNGSGFAATDTTLAGEITTGGGGLIRAQMTFAHTTGTNTSTLTRTWTANGSDTLPVTIASWGVFNAASVGTLGVEGALNATATLAIIGDSTTVTFTLTAG